VRESRAELLAILDADVVPDPSWRRHLVAAMRAHPEAAVISGRTLHNGGGFVARALALIERAYVDRGDAGETQFIASHAALFRRRWWDAHPCDTAGGPFSSRLQSEGIMRDGGEIRFEPAAVSHHAYAGWSAQRDIFRNAGFGTIVTRRIDPRLPYSWITGMGATAIPLVIAGKTWTSLGECWRLYPHYGIRGFEVPALIGLALMTRLLEAPGMWRAQRHQNLGASAYR